MVGPPSSENPHSRTMCVASWVAPTRSLAEPVDGSARTMISAARPPRRTASEAVRWLSGYRWRSNAGSCSVTPRAAPRERIVTLTTGSAGAEKEPCPGGVEVGGTEHAAVSANGVDRRFVHEVGEIGAGEPGRATRYD